MDERNPITVTADPVGPPPVEIQKGTIWQEIAEGRVPADKELQFAVNTRGDRKLERKLPSGKMLRIFRPGIARQYTCRATGQQDQEEFRLRASDALALYRDPSLKIEFRRERYEIDAVPAKE